MLFSWQLKPKVFVVNTLKPGDQSIYNSIPKLENGKIATSWKFRPAQLSSSSALMWQSVIHFPRVLPLVNIWIEISFCVDGKAPQSQEGLISGISQSISVCNKTQRRRKS